MPVGTSSRIASSAKTTMASRTVRETFSIHWKYENMMTLISDPSLNMVLLTGGSGSGSEILSSTELLNIDGSVETCDAPDLPEPRKNHVTFVTKSIPSRLATCGGSTTPTGQHIPLKLLAISASYRNFAGSLSSLNFPADYPNNHERSQTMKVKVGQNEVWLGLGVRGSFQRGRCFSDSESDFSVVAFFIRGCLEINGALVQFPPSAD